MALLLKIVVNVHHVQDGTRRKEWQQYAALVAACVAAALGKQS